MEALGQQVGKFIYGCLKACWEAIFGAKEQTKIKVGPCGGYGGNYHEWIPDDMKRMTKMKITHSDAIESIDFSYERVNGSTADQAWGGARGQTEDISFVKGEYITNISGHFGLIRDTEWSADWTVIKSLKIETNLRNGTSAHGPYGPSEGREFNLPTQGGRIAGFHGSAGKYIDSIGIYVSSKTHMT